MLDSHFEVDAATFILIEECEELVDKYLGNAGGEEETIHVKELLFVQLTMGTLSHEPPEQGTIGCDDYDGDLPVPVLHLFLRIFSCIRQLSQVSARERRQFIS